MPCPPPIRFAPIALAALLAGGCGGPPQKQIKPEDNPTFGPHDGPVAALPGGGVVEVIVEPAGNGMRLAAYFYASEAMDAPLSPAPTDVRIVLAMPGGKSIPVALSSASGDRARFASGPGDYQVDPLAGTLNATAGGAPVSLRFSGAQP